MHLFDLVDAHWSNSLMRKSICSGAVSTLTYLPMMTSGMNISQSQTLKSISA
ncbi:unnamed protein product [Periconia digitata]|uniref:Uncharacterized protein n=1 Tax=Periconia digitata TaxID=1303443 RepID=A0A9W4XIP4_9PLEO|nr:unnamed protein product [Periconia digitata]